MGSDLPYLQHLEAFFYLVQETAVSQLDAEMEVEASEFGCTGEITA